MIKSYLKALTFPGAIIAFFAIICGWQAALVMFGMIFIAMPIFVKLMLITEQGIKEIKEKK